MGIGGEGGTTTARPKTRLNRTRGFPLCYFSLFQDFNLWKPYPTVQLRTHDATTKEAESYVAPRNSQVVSDNE